MMSTETSGASASSTPTQEKVLALSFNQDCTALSMGTSGGYFLFTITQNNRGNDSPDCGFKAVKTTADQSFQDVHIVERVFFSSFIAIVSAQTPCNLFVFPIDRENEIYKNGFSSDVLTVKFSRSRLMVCLEKSISLFDLRSLRVLHTIDYIPSNPSGLIAVSPNKENPYLAYPASSTTGDIQIYHTIKLSEGVLIHAHTGPLVALSFDMAGEKIVSASEKGTVIRVHNAINGSRLFEFRRGVRRVATIYSLAFSPDSMFLAASSNTGTIHIFRLITPTANASEVPVTWRDSIGRMIGNAAYYLPQQTSQVFTQDRSFSTVHLATPGLRTTIAMNICSFNSKLILFVAGYDGVVFTYEVNTNEGGECKQLNQCALFDVRATSKNQQLASSSLEQNRLVGEYPSNTIQSDDQSTLTSNNTTFYSVQNTITKDSSDSD